MRHCVAGYDRLYARHWTTIWSLRIRDDRGEHRVLTIQVDPRSRKIVQARRARDLAPKPKDLSILRTWAEQQRLSIDL